MSTGPAQRQALAAMGAFAEVESFRHEFVQDDELTQQLLALVGSIATRRVPTRGSDT